MRRTDLHGRVQASSRGSATFDGRDWIVNSRHTADEEVLRTLASMAGLTPRIIHRVDALELVDDLILAGHGLALLPRGRTSRRGVAVRPLTDPTVRLRAFAVTRRGRDRWPPLRAVLNRLVQAGGPRSSTERSAEQR
ncbi:LysR substrate-binding domain-containing protein [Nocardioides sp. NPDC057772]|uniref:LysR substrate-binding domain-containing protein n=1 Tax=Nocardioides sp. NPDC057772 TaxID=3346245 RepID=UPI003671499E